jgi:23S rRNA (guanosine2251-2'-O)-methyltransferase
MTARRHGGDAGPEAERLVFGIHPVQEVLENRPSSVERVLCVRDRQRGLGRILRTARETGVPVSYLPGPVMARKVGPQSVHQGVAAVVSSAEYADVDDLCRSAAGDPEAVLVILDGVVDPRNLGAAIRTCAGAGAKGVILGGGGTVGLTPAAVKTSAGTVERVPVARDSRVPRRLAGLGELGFTSIGLAARGGEDWDRVDLRGRIVLVAGGEERGLRPGVARACDRRVAIPMGGGVESLNVGVALGVLLFEALRQRRVPDERS